MESISLIFKVLWSPAEAFARIVKTPRVIAVLLLTVVSSGAFAAAILTKADLGALLMRAAEQSSRVQQMTDDQKKVISDAYKGPMVKGFFVGTTLIGPIVGILLITLCFFGIFTLVGRDGTFKAFFAITAYAFVPGVFRTVVTVATVLIMPSSAIMLDELGGISPAVFLDRTAVSKMVFAAAGALDIISIWILVLLAIGFKFVVKKGVSPFTRYVCVFGLFALYEACRIALSAL